MGGVTVYLTTVGLLFTVLLFLFALAMSCKWEKLQTSLHSERYRYTALQRRRRAESEEVGQMVEEESEEVVLVKEENKEVCQAKEENERVRKTVTFSLDKILHTEKEFVINIEYVSSV